MKAIIDSFYIFLKNIEYFANNFDKILMNIMIITHSSKNNNINLLSRHTIENSNLLFINFSIF